MKLAKLKNSGFTLIELMIVVGIIGILASIGYPAYVENARTTNRSTAQADLMELASFMERNFTEATRYDQDSSGIGITTASLPYDQTPRTGIAKYDYTLAVSNVPPSFTLTATPAGTQSNDKCGTMTFNQAGAKTATGAGTCWR